MKNVYTACGKTYEERNKECQGSQYFAGMQCEDCATLYEFFISALNEEFTEPLGALNQAQYRLVDMFMHMSASA